MSLIKEIPLTMDWTYLRRVLQDMRSVLLNNVATTNQPPSSPSITAVVPLPGAVRIEWSLTNADGYDILSSPTPNWTAASGWIIDVGRSNVYTDHIGVGAIQRFYRIRARRGTGMAAPTPTVSTTTLAIGATTATVTTPPSPTTNLADATLSGQQTQVRQSGGKYVRQ